MSIENNIPEWNKDGVLPYTMERITFSPYQMTSIEFVNRFGNTRARKEILKKWLRYRIAISDKIQYGFEWVNGSFVENVEQTRPGPPNDIDVVDFVVLKEPLPAEEHQWMKKCYGVDAFMVHLLSKEAITALSSQDLFDWYNTIIQDIAQWNLQWGHTRKDVSKGFVKIVFNQDEDRQALNSLEEF